ncbi:MAG TPA: hypothetical protein VHU83_20555 [Bryobacteraceae bacterium]|jgi:hypothetical protein|nr:hypothetical protein [Bryobacteraceae bacterium]
MAMRKFTEEQILTVVKQLEAGRSAAGDGARSGREHVYDLFLESEVRRGRAE